MNGVGYQNQLAISGGTIYDRPYLYPKQERAIFSGKRWSLCEASTKSGKTVGAIVRIIEGALGGTTGQNFWWVAPVADQARIAFSRVKQNLTAGSFYARESPTPQIQLLTGAIIGFKSADNPDSLYGEDVFGLIFDEASRAKEDAWHAARSTLTATRGWGVLIGNVKGKKNWFYEFCRRAERNQDPNAHFERITWRDAVEAGVLDLEEIEDARRNLPERVFQELYEAQAGDDSGNPFGEDHIYACLLSDPDAGIASKAADGNPVAYGIDLAKYNDYLVVTGLDDSGRVVRFERWHGVPWGESIRRIHEIVGEDVPALVDSTGVGDPVLEELQKDHGNFRGQVFSRVSKQRLMEGLAVSIQKHEIAFPDGPIKNELLAFEFVNTPTGVRYSAADGYNDDCVCSLALAREQWSMGQPAANLMTYYAAQAAKARADVDAEPKQVLPYKAAIPVPVDQFDNELTELYLNTLNEYSRPRERNCSCCGAPVVGPERVTDGELVWHTGCAFVQNLRQVERVGI